MKKVAILIDGGFICRHFPHKKTKKDANNASTILHFIVKYHVNKFKQECRDHRASLYRSFYYDSEPFDKTFYNPILGDGQNFKKTEMYTFKTNFLPLITEQRKMALRLGRLDFKKEQLIISSDFAKDLLKKPREKQSKEPKPSLVKPHLIQKQVDMKIGLDLASLAYKKLVDQVVLISGDSDFVPVLKVARREGIDVVLDSMGQTIKSELSEHVDGIRDSKKNVIECLSKKNKDK